MNEIYIYTLQNRKKKMSQVLQKKNHRKSLKLVKSDPVFLMTLFQLKELFQQIK